MPWAYRKRLPEADGALWLALTDFEGGMCHCGCGQPRRLAHDPNVNWDVRTVVCYAGGAKRRWEKNQTAEADEAGVALPYLVVESRTGDRAVELAKWREERRRSAAIRAAKLAATGGAS